MDKQSILVNKMVMKLGIEDLNRKIKNCTKCRLSETRINALCGEGNLNAKLMLVAQAPGIKEDVL